MFKHASLGLVYIATDKLHWSICHMTLQTKGKGLVEVALAVVCLLSAQNVSLSAEPSLDYKRKISITIRSCTYQLHNITEKR